MCHYAIPALQFCLHSWVPLVSLKISPPSYCDRFSKRLLYHSSQEGKRKHFLGEEAWQVEIQNRRIFVSFSTENLVCGGKQQSIVGDKRAAGQICTRLAWHNSEPRCLWGEFLSPSPAPWTTSKVILTPTGIIWTNSLWDSSLHFLQVVDRTEFSSYVHFSNWDPGHP